MKTLFPAIIFQLSLAVYTAGEAFAASEKPITGYHLEPELEKAFGVHPVHPISHTEAAHDAAHSSGGLPQLDPTWYPSQLFWLVITFAVLYIFFTKTVLPALANTLESRRLKIDGDLATAREMKDEAERVHRAYEEILEEARTKAQAILAKAEEDIKVKNEKKIQALREKSMKQTEEAEAAIAKAKKEALKEMDSIAAEVASKAAEKIVGISTDVKKAKSVIDNINKEAA